MRQGLFGGIACLTASAIVLSTSTAHAQYGFTDYSVPGEPSEKLPIPTGNPGEHGFYTFFEFVYLTQSWTMGNQTVAYRGLVDSTGLVTGLPGTYLGSGVEALSTNDFGRRSWAPGYNIGIGYKTDDGTSFYASFMQTRAQTNSNAATLASPFFRSGPDLSDTFLVAGVFNFPPQYAGPEIATPIEADLDGNSFYGIWNGASDMGIDFKQRFTETEIGARVPLFQTEYSRIYGLAGARFNWFFERFQWHTFKYDINGLSGPRDASRYNNTLSQRMYGAFVGCGHEVYVGKRFSVSGDVTAAGLINFTKQRAKYKLMDNTIQNKMSRNDATLVPSFTGDINLWWYPVEGVQMRVGYNAWTFFNTQNMQNPIGFNYGAIDPVYGTQHFRIVHGLNVGLGLFF